MIGVVVAAVVVAVVAAAIWFAKVHQHPEQTADHHDATTDTTSERFSRSADRPAGPGVDDAVDPSSPGSGHDPSGPDA